MLTLLRAEAKRWGLSAHGTREELWKRMAEAQSTDSSLVIFPDKPSPWKHVRNFDDFKLLMMRFLHGEIDHTVSHGGPLDAESLPLIEVLSHLIMRNVVPVDSQPGTVSLHGLNEVWEVHQRSYLTAYVPERLAQKLIKRLSSRCWIVDLTTGQAYGLDVPTTSRINLTRQRKLGTRSWQLPTNLRIEPSTEEMNLLLQNNPLAAWNMKACRVLTFIAPRFGEIELFHTVLRATN